MDRFYLMPILAMPDGGRGPKYLEWHEEQEDPYLAGYSWAMMDYGFSPNALAVVKDIEQVDHDWLVGLSDVFAFPENLDGPVDQDVQDFFEGVNLPTDWLTPATTWRELMRQTAGMFQFNQRYGGIAAVETGELHSIFDNADLGTRLRQMTEDEQRWFLAAVESFGFDPGLVNDNSQLRLLVKQAGNFWIGQTFYLGGMEF